MTYGEKVRELMGVLVTDRMIADTLHMYFACDACGKGEDCQRVFDGCRFAMLDRLQKEYRENTPERVTNGDSIRRKTDDELARLIWNIMSNPGCHTCPAKYDCQHDSGDCYLTIRRFLKKGAGTD